MALFSQKGKDADIPMQTALYQLEFDRNGDAEDREELREFAARYYTNPGVTNLDFVRKRLRSTHPQHYDHLANVIRLARSTMDSLEDRRTYSRNNRAQLEMFEEIIGRPRRVVELQGDAQDTQADELPLDETRVTAVFNPLDMLAQEILDFLWSLLEQPETVERLKRCPQCGSVFWSNPSKSRQKFCSDRCGNRARVARVHRTKKEKLSRVSNDKSVDNVIRLCYA